MEDTKKETEVLFSGRLEDLASNPKFLDEYLGIRVDIKEDTEVGTIVAHGRTLEDVKNLMEKDMTNDHPGNEYHIFHPQKADKTAREVSSVFAPGNRFGRIQR